MHVAAYAFIAEALRRHGRPTGLVVEIGGKDINGSVRPLFGEPYISVDVRPGPGVDVVGDGATYAPLEPAGCVVCCEVLEHTADAQAICANAVSMLVPGGVLLLTAAGEGRAPHSAEDGGPLRDGEFYRNVTAADLDAWLSACDVLQITLNRAAGDIYAIARKRLAS
jgi:SAM-dependent methyltransferase